MSSELATWMARSRRVRADIPAPGTLDATPPGTLDATPPEMKEAHEHMHAILRDIPVMVLTPQQYNLNMMEYRSFTDLPGREQAHLIFNEAGLFHLVPTAKYDKRPFVFGCLVLPDGNCGVVSGPKDATETVSVLMSYDAIMRRYLLAMDAMLRHPDARAVLSCGTQGYAAARYGFEGREDDLRLRCADQYAKFNEWRRMGSQEEADGLWQHRNDQMMHEYNTKSEQLRTQWQQLLAEATDRQRGRSW